MALAHRIAAARKKESSFYVFVDGNMLAAFARIVAELGNWGEGWQG